QRGEEEEKYRKDHQEEVRRLNAKQVRYTAVLTLARRKSPHLRDHLDVLGEMLDEKKQLDLWASEDPGRATPSEDDARATALAALRTLDYLRRNDPGIKLDRFRPAVERLAGSPNQVVRSQATGLLRQWD